MAYDLIVLGSGPGGYVAAIRASQLGMKTAIVERESLGGICLNWGCIPTKALLKSAQVFNYLGHAADYGITVGSAKADFGGIVSRSRGVADKMSNGVQFLMKKNKIDVIMGTGKLLAAGKLEVTDDKGKKSTVEAKNIIVATGARSRSLDHIPQDGKQIIGYREAMTLPKLPKKMVVMGSGAIGSGSAASNAAIDARKVSSSVPCASIVFSTLSLIFGKDGVMAANPSASASAASGAVERGSSAASFRIRRPSVGSTRADKS